MTDDSPPPAPPVLTLMSCRHHLQVVEAEYDEYGPDAPAGGAGQGVDQHLSRKV